MFTYEIRKEIACEMVEYIKNYGIEDMYLCDIASELYDTDYYMIGIYQCKEWLKEHFDDMLTTIEYWEDETGEPYGQMITEVERLATLVVYTVADNVLYEVLDDLEIDNNVITRNGYLLCYENIILHDQNNSSSNHIYLDQSVSISELFIPFNNSSLDFSIAVLPPITATFFPNFLITLGISL